jgi:hypothetical protein
LKLFELINETQKKNVRKFVLKQFEHVIVSKKLMKNLVLLGILILMFSCKKKDQESVVNNPVPYVPVNYTLYPNDPAYYKIQFIGGWMYIDGVGINGIIVYRKSEEEFLVIERTSSYLPNNASAKVKVMNDNFLLLDSVSDSRWRITDAQVSKGPAQWPLRIYGSTYFNSALRITN